MRFYLVSLGCPKNEVDADNMAQLLKEAGHSVVPSPDDADVLIVNTCGFIEPAREESLGTLRELADRKRPDQKLVAAGCFTQLFQERLLELVPGLDALLGTRRWMEIAGLIEDLDGQNGPAMRVDEPSVEAVEAVKGRVLRSRPAGAAYLRIAEGCDAPCAFCSIPMIKGPLVSRPVDDILDEARFLASQGAKELVLVAQDTTAYGRDRGERDALPGLIEAILAAAPEVAWLRIMYAYPQHVSERLIELMAREPRICRYLDLPLQHAHPATLKRMRRPHDSETTERLLSRLREAMPEIALRSTFIVGFPGETEEEFEALASFLRKHELDRVGVFQYSPEAGTPAASLPDQVPFEVSEDRYHRLMSLQQRISLKRNREQVGKTLEVLVEGNGEGVSVGRSYRDAPEVDGLVVFKEEAPPGQIVSVQVHRAGEYDLTGKWVHKRGRRSA